MRRFDTFIVFATLVVAAVFLSVPMTRWVVAAAGLQESYGFSVIPSVIILAIVLWFAQRVRLIERQTQQAARETQLVADAQRAE